MAKERAVAASASEEMDVGKWLDHGEGGGGQFLTINFDEEDEYKIWLKPKTAIRILWRHTFKQLSQDKKKIFLFRFQSMESEGTLDRQNFREDDGTREYPPQVCPFSLTMEWVYEQIIAGRIKWTDPIFEFEAEESDAETIYAGGWVGMFGKKDLSDEQKAEIRKLGIKIHESYKQSGRAQDQTVFIVINNNAPGDGPQICVMNRGLAKAWKDEVKKRIKGISKPEEKWKGDPSRNPVCFSLAREKKKGEVPRMIVTATDDPLTDEIKAQFDAPNPDTSKLFAPSNIAVLEELFREHWCHEVEPPWDDLFAKAYEREKGKPWAELPTDFEPEDKDDGDEDDEESDDEKEETSADAGGDAAPAEGDAPCDACGKLIPDAAFTDPKVATCPHCGAKYDFDEKAGEFKLRPKEEPKVEAPKTEEPAPRTSNRRRGGK